jgi:glycosyltransferase involved in cell wall biosynthesis
MKILHVVPSYMPAYRYGGPIMAVHGLCKGLFALGHDVTVFTTNIDGPGNSNVPLGVEVDRDGVKVWYYPPTHFRRFYWSPDIAKALWNKVSSFDLLHLHSIYLWPTTIAAHMARRQGVPYLLAPLGMLVKNLVHKKNKMAKSLWLQLVEKRNIEAAAGMHFTSKIESREAAKFGYHFPAEFIVPNGIDFETPVSASVTSPIIKELQKKRNLILFIGRISWEKGLDRLIPAMRHIPDAYLAIVGNDENHYRPVLDELAAAHGISDRVFFTGPLYGYDKNSLLKHASVLVLPSYSENFGIIVLEAMAAACPVLVTPEVGAADIVREYRCGIVLDGDPDILGKGLRDMLRMPSQLAEMGRRGRIAVEENFTWSVVSRQMEKVYAKVLQYSK